MHNVHYLLWYFKFIQFCMYSICGIVGIPLFTNPVSVNKACTIKTMWTKFLNKCSVTKFKLTNFRFWFIFKDHLGYLYVFSTEPNWILIIVYFEDESFKANHKKHTESYNLLYPMTSFAYTHHTYTCTIA